MKIIVHKLSAVVVIVLFQSSYYSNKLTLDLLFIAKSNSICPDKDAHGTDLTDTISNDDGSVTCTFGNSICYYDVSIIFW